MEQNFIHRIVEAALMAANQPLTLAQLHGLFSLDDPAPDGSVEQALERLQAECADRGVELVELASGFRFQVKADVHPWVARLWTERQTKYTRATLETLALIAYRQPLTRAEIEAVRGVAVNPNIIRTLHDLTREPEAMSHPQGTQLRVSRQELARLVGCSREMAGRVLKKLQADGVLHARGKTVVLYGTR